MTYQSVPSASIPAPHSDAVPIPKQPSPGIFSLVSGPSGATDFTDENDPTYVPDVEDNEPKPLSQIEMDYIVAKLGLSQRSAEFLTSLLKHRKLLQKTVKVTSYRQRQAEFQRFFTSLIF